MASLTLFTAQASDGNSPAGHEWPPRLPHPTLQYTGGRELGESPINQSDQEYAITSSEIGKAMTIDSGHPDCDEHHLGDSEIFGGGQPG